MSATDPNSTCQYWAYGNVFLQQLVTWLVKLGLVTIARQMCSFAVLPSAHSALIGKRTPTTSSDLTCEIGTCDNSAIDVLVCCHSSSAVNG
jgi:hypothetical protein